MNIFLAAPFTGRIDPSTQLIEQSYRRWLEGIIQYLEHKGHRVISAHTREDWGDKLEPPEIALQNDFYSVKGCDLLVAYPGNPPSPGVHIEVGIAIALGKPVIIFHENDSPAPYLDKGLGKLTRAFHISFTNKDQLFKQLGKELEILIKVLKAD